MNSKINGLLAGALRQVRNGAPKALSGDDAVKRPARQGSPSCESLEGRVVLSNWGGADLLGGLSQIGVVTGRSQQVQQTSQRTHSVVPLELLACGFELLAFYVVRSTPWIALIIRSNSARSAASWRRPAAVSV